MHNLLKKTSKPELGSRGRHPTSDTTWPVPFGDLGHWVLRSSMATNEEKCGVMEPSLSSVETHTKEGREKRPLKINERIQG